MTAELRTFVDIEASPERVWRVLTDLPAYPEWNPFVTTAEGTFAVGSAPKLCIAPLNSLLRTTVRATVLEVEPCRRLRFRLRLARLPGLFDIDHRLTITPQETGVRLWEEAQFQGLLVRLVAARSLDHGRSPAFVDMNKALKERIETGG